MKVIKPIAKAVVAAVVSGGAVAMTALGDGSISAIEWIEIGTAVVVAGAAVWGIPNKPAK